MSDFKTFNGESILLSSDDGTIILTNYRIRLQKFFTIKSIPLQHINGIEITYVSHPWLVLLGLLLAISGVVGATEEEAFLGLVVVGVVMIVIYFVTRKHSIVINSGGKTSISFITKGMAREKVLGFVNEVEKAIAEHKHLS